jgi:hypothetical protein
MNNFKSNIVLFFLFLVFCSATSAQLTYPTKYPTAVIPHTGDNDRLFFLYMPMIYLDSSGHDIFKLYYYNKATDRRYLARSTNYGITWTDTSLVSFPTPEPYYQYEAIIKKPDSAQFMAYNRWYVFGGIKGSYMTKAISTNGGLTFTDTGKVMALGEDKSFIWNSDENEYWGYVRPRNITPDCECYTHNCYTVGNGVRKIALMKNGGFFPNAGAWSARDTIVAIDSAEYININSPDYRTQTYYMQVFRNGSDWWGLVGMYRVGNNGGETNDYPYTDPEYTSDVELMWSDNGVKWYRTNNRNPFIPLHDSIKTIYSVGTVVKDSVYFYSIESTRLHATYTIHGCGNDSVEKSAFAGKYYSIYLYKMGISKLNDWRPPSKVNVTATIEGFLDSVMHNMRDTMTAELRNTTSPFSVVSTIKAVIDSVNFTGLFLFPHASPENYYLTLEGRNSLETWSASGIPIGNDSSTSYNFTNAGAKAYGSNLKLKAGKYCIYSGDVNNDGFIDLTDILLIYVDSDSFVTGYADSDVNGNSITDLTDVMITYNNFSDFISVIKP